MERMRFDDHEGVAAPLLQNNIDTDQIIPSREIGAVSRDGLAEGLFAGWRYQSSEARTPNPDFVLNQPIYRGATILICGDNFGCGSSREHAAWALAEYGIKVIIARSFGEIFYNNCAKNGILAVSLGDVGVDAIASYVAKDPQANKVRVDLAQQIIICLSGESQKFSFVIEPYPKRLLQEGVDPIGLTLLQRDEIAAFHEQDQKVRPWVYH